MAFARRRERALNRGKKSDEKRKSQENHGSGKLFSKFRNKHGKNEKKINLTHEKR